MPVLEGAATELGWPGTPDSPPLALSEPLGVLRSPPPCPAAGSGISGQQQGQRAEAMAGPRSAALGAQSRARRPWVSLGVPGCPGVSPRPADAGASIPTSAHGDGTGSEGPRTAPASLPSVPNLHQARETPGTRARAGGRQVRVAAGVPAGKYSPRHGAVPRCTRGGGARRSSLAPRASNPSPRILHGCQVPLPPPEWAGGFIGPASAGEVSGLWLRAQRPVQDTSQSPPRGGQAQPSWTNLVALLVSVAT